MWNGVLRCFSSFGAGSNNGKRLGVSQVHLLWISLTLLSSVNSFFFAKTCPVITVSTQDQVLGAWYSALPLSMWVWITVCVWCLLAGNIRFFGAQMRLPMSFWLSFMTSSTGLRMEQAVVRVCLNQLLNDLAVGVRASSCLNKAEAEMPSGLSVSCFWAASVLSFPQETNKKTVHAKYCSRFVHAPWKDGSLVHVCITKEKYTWFSERMHAVLAQIQRRLVYLHEGPGGPASLEIQICLSAW